MLRTPSELSFPYAVTHAMLAEKCIALNGINVVVTNAKYLIDANKFN